MDAATPPRVRRRRGSTSGNTSVPSTDGPSPSLCDVTTLEPRVEVRVTRPTVDQNPRIWERLAPLSSSIGSVDRVPSADAFDPFVRPAIDAARMDELKSGFDVVGVPVLGFEIQPLRPVL